MPKAIQGRPVQRRVLALLPALGITHDGLAAHLEAAWGRSIDRSLVSRWARGDRAMPLDAVVELCRYASATLDDVEEEVALRLLDPLLRQLGLVGFRVPEAAGDELADLPRRGLAIGAAAGSLQADIGLALADEELDAEERAGLVGAARETIAELQRLVTMLEEGGSRPRAVSR